MASLVDEVVVAAGTGGALLHVCTAPTSSVASTLVDSASVPILILSRMVVGCWGGGRSRHRRGTWCTPRGVGTGRMRMLSPAAPDRLRWVGSVYSDSVEPTLVLRIIGTTSAGMSGHVENLIRRGGGGPSGTCACVIQRCN